MRVRILITLFFLLANFTGVANSPVSAQSCDLEYGDYYWEDSEGSGQIRCGFVGSEGDLIDVNCSGCADLEIIAPGGRSLDISMQNSRAVLPTSGTYEITFNYSFGSEEQQEWIPETCVEVSCGVDAGTGSGGGCIEECSGGNYQSYVTYYTGTPWLHLSKVDSSIVRNVVYGSGVWNYSTQQWDRQQIFVSDEQLSSPIRITWTGENYTPDLSADGTKITFVSDRDQNGSTDGFGHGEIYVMNADGSDQKRLTESTADDSEPNWSPDGSKIVFMSSADGSMENWEIFVMNADGSGLVQLTENNVADRLPSWSPDGKTIIFGRAKGSGYELHLMNADGSGEGLLSGKSILGARPSYSPDGSRIVYNFFQDDDVTSIFVMNADGSDPVRLTSGDRYNPVWSPDGSQIMFVSVEENSGEQVYVMDADGSNVAQLTTNSDRYFAVSNWAVQGIVISDAPASTISNLSPTLESPVLNDTAGDNSLCSSASGQVEVSFQIDELWIKDPEEADTTSIVGGDEAFVYYGIGIINGDDADFGANQEFVEQWDADASGGDRFTNFDPISRTISCGETFVIYIAAVEDDSPWGGSSTLGEEPIRISLSAGDIPELTPRTELVFSGETHDGQYDYRLYYTLEISPS